jgi:acetyl esterase/lipase
MTWNTLRSRSGNPTRTTLLFAALAAICATSLHAQAAAPVSPVSAAPAVASARPAKPDPPPNGFAKIINLWPDAPPMAAGTGPTDIPKLYYFPAAGANAAHSAVIVLPGGGYNHLVNEKEGGVEARWLAAHGVAAFVLQYRLAPYRFPVPMMDGMRAVRYVRAHAADFGAEPNRIGVFGFSAGGHLASYLSVAPDESSATSPDPIERVSPHPDFAIIAYGRMSMDPLIPRAGNMEALIGDKPTAEALDEISTAKHVTATTPPTFIYSTTGDQTVNSLNATAYYDALKRAGVPAELHIFELGPHGTGMGQNLPGLTELAIWPLLLEQWMQQHNWMAVPNVER